MANRHFDRALARKLSAFRSPEEVKCLAELQLSRRQVKRGEQFVREGQSGHKAFVLQAGWACSYKDLPMDAARSFRLR